MAHVRRNGVLLKSTGPDSGERRMGKRANSAPGRDATQWLCYMTRTHPRRRHWIVVAHRVVQFWPTPINRVVVIIHGINDWHWNKNLCVCNYIYIYCAYIYIVHIYIYIYNMYIYIYCTYIYIVHIYILYIYIYCTYIYIHIHIYILYKFYFHLLLLLFGFGSLCLSLLLWPL